MIGMQGNGAREEEGSVSAARARELERDNAEMAAAVTALRQRYGQSHDGPREEAGEEGRRMARCLICVSDCDLVMMIPA